MPSSNVKLRKLWKPAFLCAVGLWALSAAVSEWLSESALSGQIWPADINAAVVSALGGVVEVDSIGHDRTALPTHSVWLRLAGLTGILATISVFRRRGTLRSEDRDIDVGTALRHTAMASFLLSAWWMLWIAGTLIPSIAAFCLGCLPLWVGFGGALLIWIWSQTIVPAAQDSDTASSLAAGQRSSIGPVALLCLAMTGWTAISFWMNVCLYQQLLIPHGDSAMYEEHLWNVWHGKGFRSYLDQGLFLGEHIQVIHLLLLPLHMLWPSHLLLELTESVALASCAVPVYLIARRHTGQTWASAMLGVAWLFYYPMHFLDIAIDQKTFRPIALGVPFLFWMIEFSERRRFGWTLLCLLLALSAKEDLALVTFPLLIVLAITVSSGISRSSDSDDRRREVAASRRWLLTLAGFSALYLVAAVLVIIPAFRSGEHVHYSRYFGDLGGTPSELIRTAVTDPLRVLRRALSVRTTLYACVFLVPLALLPLRKAWLLSAGILTFGMLSLLQFDTAGSGDLPPVPYHHFHAPLLPVVFWAAIVAVAHSPPWRNAVWKNAAAKPERSVILLRATLVLLCCMGTSVTGSIMPCGAGFWSQQSPFGYSQLFAPDDEVQQRRAAMAEVVVQQIPVTARVASTDYIHTRFTHHARSYDYSNYLRAVNNYQPGVPEDTDYIVIDTGHRYSEIQRPEDVPELQQHPDLWELLPDKTNGAFIVLKRR
ncbi:MAG: DUF2079 domain-containing protein [Planctomycetaceae bacterium]